MENKNSCLVIDLLDNLLSGNPLPNPGHNCAFLDTAGQHTWQSSSCSKKLGYICYKDGASPAPPQSKENYMRYFTLLYEHNLCMITCVQHLHAVFSS